MKKNVFYFMGIIIIAFVVYAEQPSQEISDERLSKLFNDCEYSLDTLYFDRRRVHDDFVIKMHTRIIELILEMLPYLNYDKNTRLSDFVGRVPSDNAHMAEEFRRKLQKSSQKYAQSALNPSSINFISCTRAIAIHSHLCENVIKASGCDCKGITEMLKQLAFEQIAERDSIIESNIQGEQEYLESDLEILQNRFAAENEGRRKNQQELIELRQKLEKC